VWEWCAETIGRVKARDQGGRADPGPTCSQLSTAPRTIISTEHRLGFALERPGVRPGTGILIKLALFRCEALARYAVGLQSSSKPLVGKHRADESSPQLSTTESTEITVSTTSITRLSKLPGAKH